MKVNTTLDELDISLFQDEDSNFPLITLDGFTIEKHYKGGSNKGEISPEFFFQTSYDNDYDQGLSNILEGVKNPNQADRASGRGPKKVFFPKKLLNFRKKPITFWIESEKNLSEILSLYPALSARIVLGKLKAKRCVDLIIYLLWKRGLRLSDVPLGNTLFETLERRCFAHNYEGDWALVSHLLQVNCNKVASYLYIKERFPKDELIGNILPNGEKLFNQLIIELSAFPVNRPNRKRGHNDKGSKKSSSTIREAVDNFTKIHSTRDELSLSEHQAVVHYLYGLTNPRKIIEEPDGVKEYRRKLNRQQRQKNLKEKERVKALTGEIKVWVDKSIIIK